MDLNPEDLWRTCKQGWVPQPRWLSAEVAVVDLRSGRSPKLPAPLAARRPERSTHRRAATDRPETAPVHTGSPDRLDAMDNVVELRPHARDHAYAEAILDALTAACEAEAAGQHDLMMARIRKLYGLFGHLAR